MRKSVPPLPATLKEVVASNVNDELRAKLRQHISKIADDNRDPDIVTQVRHYKLITPLFGGGVEPGVNDDVTPISGKAIRGQLRFWWRATRGGLMTNEMLAINELDEKKRPAALLKKMKEKEERIWGAASTKREKNESKIKIEIEIVTDKKGNKAFGYELPREQYGYLTFPLKDNKNVLVNVHFNLKLEYPSEFKADIKATLWAWGLFGGIGARTRRGCGAVHLKSVEGEQGEPLPSNDEGWRKSLKNGLNDNVIDGTWPAGVPRLERDSQFVITRLESGEDERAAIKGAWERLIKKLKSFRQLRTETRLNALDGHGNPKVEYSRSYWPEPEKIRELLDQRLPKHKPMPNRKLDEFPRAAFGLPIVFHFKDAAKKDRNNPAAYNPNNRKKDPRDTSLQLEDHERLASPLILRPLICQGNKAVGLALIINSSFALEAVTLVLKAIEGTKKECRNISAKLDKTKAKTIIRPDKNTLLLGDETDVLKAFLTFLTEDETI
jgi:CRISPR-associated protein Cmr1